MSDIPRAKYTHRGVSFRAWQDATVVPSVCVAFRNVTHECHSLLLLKCSLEIIFRACHLEGTPRHFNEIHNRLILLPSKANKAVLIWLRNTGNFSSDVKNHIPCLQTNTFIIKDSCWRFYRLELSFVVVDGECVSCTHFSLSPESSL